MSDYIKKYIDELIEKENQRRYWENLDTYQPVTPDEAEKLIEEDKLRRQYEQNNGR